jgi:hypothetical protein
MKAHVSSILLGVEDMDRSKQFYTWRSTSAVPSPTMPVPPRRHRKAPAHDWQRCRALHRPGRVRVGRCTNLNRTGTAHLHGELGKSWQEQMMKFRSYVEPPEPMRGLEVPPEVVEALGGGKRPAVTITINGRSSKEEQA